MKRVAPFGPVVACACAVAGGSAPAARVAPPPRPEACPEIAAVEPLQERLDAAPPGSALCLAAGVHLGPIRVRQSLTLWGPPDSVVRSSGRGTTVAVEAAGVRLAGFTIDGSGSRYDLLDAALHVTADDVTVESLTIERAGFGILVERARRVTLRGNLVHGDPAQLLGLRGDGIRLWETSDSVVEDNRVHDSRDLVVWYSPRNRLSRNHITGSRYAAHLMYSHDCTVEDNQAVDNVVGVFVMYTHGATIRGNLLAGADGAAGMGVGLKDSGNITLTGNRIVDDTVGLYIDNSPVQLSDTIRIEGNHIRACDRAVVFHGEARRSSLRGNVLVDNRVQVEHEGNGDQVAGWEGNYFDDYTGYDLDEDGRGDVAYELRSLRGEIVARYPDLRFFEGVPALGLADAAARLIPLYRPALVVRDPQPLVRPPRFSGERHAP